MRQPPHPVRSTGKPEVDLGTDTPSRNRRTRPSRYAVHSGHRSARPSRSSASKRRTSGERMEPRLRKSSAGTQSHQRALAARYSGPTPPGGDGSARTGGRSAARHGDAYTPAAPAGGSLNHVLRARHTFQSPTPGPRGSEGWGSNPSACASVMSRDIVSRCLETPLHFWVILGIPGPSVGREYVAVALSGCVVGNSTGDF